MIRGHPSVRVLAAAAEGATNAALADERRLTMRSQTMAATTTFILAAIAWIAKQESPANACFPAQPGEAADVNRLNTTTTTTTTTFQVTLPEAEVRLTPMIMSFNLWFTVQFGIQFSAFILFSCIAIALALLMRVRGKGSAAPYRRSTVVRHTQVPRQSVARQSVDRQSMARVSRFSHYERSGAGSQPVSADSGQPNVASEHVEADHTLDAWTPAGAIGHVDGDPGHQPCTFVHVPDLSKIVFEFADGTTDSKKGLEGVDRDVGFALAPQEHIIAISGSQTLWLKAIRFHTNFGRISSMYGNYVKSGAFRAKARPGMEICSLGRVGLWRPVIGAIVEREVLNPLTPPDLVEPEGVRLTQVDIRESNAAIEAIIFSYSDGTKDIVGDHTVGMWQDPFELEEDEYIVSVVGRQALRLNAVQFVTNKRRLSTMYGDTEEGDLFYQHASGNRQVWSVIRDDGPNGGPIAAVVEAFLSEAGPPVPPPAPPKPAPPTGCVVRILRIWILVSLTLLFLLYVFMFVWIVVGVCVAFTNDAHNFGITPHHIWGGGGRVRDICWGAKFHFWINMLGTILNHSCCMRNSAPGLVPPPPKEEADPATRKAGFSLVHGQPVQV